MKKFPAVTVALAGVTLVLTGCQQPLQRSMTQTLREQMLQQHRAYLDAVAGAPTIEVQRQPVDLWSNLPEDRRRIVAEQVEAMSGPASYQTESLNIGMDLINKGVPPELFEQRAGKQIELKRLQERAQNANRALNAEEQKQADALRADISQIESQISQLSQSVALTLQRAIELAARHNLAVEQARLIPAINQAQITQAEAAFDAIYFLDVEHNNLDTPRPMPVTVFPGLLSNNQQTVTTSLRTGIRKPLSSGGQIRVDTGLSRNSLDPTSYTDNPYYVADVAVSLTQPLLRNFGSDVNRAQILLSRSQRRQSVEDLRTRLLQIMLETEAAYWRLSYSRQALLIQQRLLERTDEDLRTLMGREGFDVSPVRITEATSFAELRRAEVIRARQQVRGASDALKRLMNSPDLPLSDETLIQPLDAPADVAVQVNLLDAVMTALRHRPELQRALLEISDASIRIKVAENLKLPVLNVSATARFNGEAGSGGKAYSNLADGDYIDYLLGLQFEAPIGNRAAEGALSQRRFERRTAVVNYQNQAQEIVLQVKDAMRELATAYELIGATRTARRASADSLRSIMEQERVGVGLTPEFLLDLKLQTQQRLADAELQEMQALTGYNTAIANYYRAMGTLTDRNNVTVQPAER